MKLKNVIVALTASTAALSICTLMPEKWADMLGTELTAYAATSGFWSYEKNTEKEIRITGYSGVDSEITIPTELDGFKVVEIGQSAFEKSTSIEKVIIPDTITTIGHRAFYASSIVEVTVPTSVMTWGTSWGDAQQFADCTKLEKVTFNSKEVPTDCFYNCDALTTVIIGDATEKISDEAFAKCEALSTVTFGTGMKEIGDSAFAQDKKLEIVEVKSNLSAIHGSAFADCESLSHISLGTELTTLGAYAFTNTGLVEVTIPASVTTWGTSWGENNAFRNCSKLTTVTINSKEIPNYCFYNCDLLTTVKCGDLTETIGGNAFSDCAVLEKVSLGTAMCLIGDSAFKNNKNLVNVEIKSNLERIENVAFENCEKLTDIFLGRTLQYIGHAAFKNTGLVEITIPSSVTEWGTSWSDSNAFADCKNLTVANVGTTIDLPPRTFDGAKNVNIHCSENSGAHKYATENQVAYTLEEAIPATGVQLHAGEFTMITGTSMQVYPVLTPQNTTDKITWVSGNTEIAEISASGKVTAKKAGLTAIKVTTASGKTASATLTVVDEGTAVEDVVEQKDITSAKVEGIKTFKPGDTEFGEKVYFNFCTKLIRNTDYTISCVEDVQTNSVKILIQGIGEYKGTITIEKENIEAFTVNGVADQGYTGDAITLPIEIVATNGMKLTADTDYIVTYAQNTDVGTATVTLEGTGHYVGKIVKEFKIVPMSVEGFELSGIENKVYTGSEITLPLILKNGKGIELFVDKDYTVQYTNNTNAGVATVEVSGIGNYTGKLTKTFEIAQKTIESYGITPFKNQAYNGQEIKLTVELFDGANKPLVLGTDYVCTYSDDCVNAGIVTVTIQGIGNYTGVLEKSYKIEPIVIDEYMVSGIVDKTYTGFAHLQTVKVVDKAGTELVLDKDYAIMYMDNTNAGTATVAIAGIGNYTGGIIKTFVINPFDIKSATVSLSPSSFVYDGTAKMPAVTIKNGNVTLVNNKDFKVTYAQNAVVGTATATISGVGNYTGSVQKTFKIVLGKVSGIKQSGSQSSASATLTWSAVPGASGYEIYRATSKNGTYKKVKTQAAVTLKNTGLSAGSRYYYKVRAYKTVGTTKVYGTYSNVIAVLTLPKTPKLTLEASTSAITAKWDKLTGCKGYELYMSTSKNGTYTRIKNANASTVYYKKSGLSSGKTYYFKVRSYITDATGKKVYSNYSNVVSGMKLPKAPSVKLTAGKKSVKVSWSKATGCQGYELYMATSANGTYKKIKSGNVTSCTKTGLQSGKTYYFKLRSYTKNAAGKKIMSSYSAVKSIKVK